MRACVCMCVRVGLMHREKNIAFFPVSEENQSCRKPSNTIKSIILTNLIPRQCWKLPNKGDEERWNEERCLRVYLSSKLGINGFFLRWKVGQKSSECEHKEYVKGFWHFICSFLLFLYYFHRHYVVKIQFALKPPNQIL